MVSGRSLITSDEISVVRGHDQTWTRAASIFLSNLGLSGGARLPHIREKTCPSSWRLKFGVLLYTEERGHVCVPLIT